MQQPRSPTWQGMFSPGWWAGAHDRGARRRQWAPAQDLRRVRGGEARPGSGRPSLGVSSDLPFGPPRVCCAQSLTLGRFRPVAKAAVQLPEAFSRGRRNGVLRARDVVHARAGHGPCSALFQWRCGAAAQAPEKILQHGRLAFARRTDLHARTTSPPAGVNKLDAPSPHSRSRVPSAMWRGAHSG
jgi:hypothetical protein